MKKLLFVFLFVLSSFFVFSQYNFLSGDDFVFSKNSNENISEEDPFYMQVSPSSFYFTPNGGSELIKVESNVNWTVTCSEGWIFTSITSGSNDNQFNLTAVVNSTSQERSASVFINGDNGVPTVTILVSQSGIANLWLMDVSPESLSFESYGGQQSFSIASNVNWAAVSTQSWLSISPTSGNNNGSITASLGPNPSTSERTASIIVTGSNGVASKTVSVSQAGVSDIYSLEISPNVLIFDAQGGTKNLQLASNVNWTVSKNVDWLTIDPQGGSGDANLSVLAAENDNDQDRIAKISVKGDNGVGTKFISVKQLKDPNDILESINTRFDIYPNPANDILNIINAESASLSVINAIGQVLVEVKPLSNNEQLDISSFEAGTYFLKLQMNDNIKIKKLVILK